MTVRKLASRTIMGLVLVAPLAGIVIKEGPEAAILAAGISALLTIAIVAAAGLLS